MVMYRVNSNLQNMKKLLIFASAAIATLFAGACQREEVSSAAEEVSVSLSLQVPSVQTKAIAKAELTDVVYYEIWNSDLSKKLYPLEGQEPVCLAVENCQATLDITLVSAQTYNFIFWAQNKNCGAYDVTDLKSVKVDYSVIGAAGNQDKFDAFYAVKKIAVAGPINESVTLYRPFAQLNFGADAMTTIFGNVNVGLSSVKLSSLATQFNTISGMGEGEIKDVVFNADGIVTDKEALEVNAKSYTWVSMNYVLMHDQQSVAQVDAEFNLGMDVPVKHSISAVPLKKNYRTNIVGNLFTADAELSIVVEPSFAQPDEEIVIK